MTNRILGLLFVIIVPISGNAAGLTAEEKREVTVGLASQIEQQHFDPVVRQSYSQYLAAAIRRIDDLSNDPDEFALELHRALQAVSRDGHMGVYGPARTRRILGLPEFEGLGNATSVEHTEHDSPEFAISPLQDGGVLIKLDSFSGAESHNVEVLKALSSTPDPSYLLMDLRGNGGGDAALFRSVAGCLFAEEMPLFAIDWRDGDGIRRAESRSKPDTRCRQFWSVPMAILVDAGTASTAELAAFVLKARGRAVVVGEPTYGASHAAEFFELPGGFGAMIPIGRTFDPVTGKDWERTGVVPDRVCHDTPALECGLAQIKAMQLCASMAKLAPVYDCSIADANSALD